MQGLSQLLLPSFSLLEIVSLFPSWKGRQFWLFLEPSAGYDPLGERKFGEKQKKIMADVSDSQLWLSVGHGGGQGEGTFEEVEHSSIWFS